MKHGNRRAAALLLLGIATTSLAGSVQLVAGASESQPVALAALIGPLPGLRLIGIDWVIVGGESGHKARPMDSQWVLDIMDNCKVNKVAFFFKQWGGINKKKAGRLLNGQTYDEMPDFRIDEL